MKKFAALLLCVAMLFTLAACGSQTSAPAANTGAGDAAPAASGDEVIELELWYWQSSLNDQLIEQVSTQFPNIKINANKFNSENMQEKVVSALASNSDLPDILCMDDWVSMLLPDADKFYNLYDLGAADYEDQYVDWKWQKAMTADGKMIGFPIDAGPTVMFYRADLFEAAGLPSDPAEVSAQFATWDGALAAAKTMKETTGVNMFDFTKNLYWMMICQQPQGLVDENNEFIGDSAGAKEAFYTAAEFTPYCFGMDSMYGTEWAAAMNNGDVAAYCSAVWTIDMLKGDAPDTAGNWRVAQMPGGPANYGGSCLGIPATSEHPEEAFQVITWLQNAQNQAIQLKENSLFPTNLEALSNPELMAADEFFGGQVINEIFAEATRNIPPQYVGLNYSSYRQYFYDELMLITTGKDVDQAWNDALANCEMFEAIN